MPDVSRQRRWQLEQNAKGNCETCGCARSEHHRYCNGCLGKRTGYFKSETYKFQKRATRRP